MQSFDESRKFKVWKSNLEKNGNQVHSVTDLHSVRKGNGEILFSLLKMDATSPEGNPLLPIAMIRGNFVSVTTCLRDQDSGEEFLLLVRQRRVANGAMFYEHPAGMMDQHTDPFEIALIEMHEETGMEITRESLHQLNEELFYSSPGLLDEGGYFFCCELELSREEIMSYHLQSGGEGGEGEFIQTYIATPAEARKLILNSNGLLGIFLWQEWRAKKAV
jgi:8-oxo-dGTP pyrophosphatase MutT (NUDIX family)